MTCKDCIHFDVCEWADLKEYPNEEKMRDACSNFKNNITFVEVVRCENCKNYNGHRFCIYFADTVVDDDFCSYGERKSK